APSHVPVRERLRLGIRRGHRIDRLTGRREAAIEVEVVEELAACAEVAVDVDLRSLARNVVLTDLVEAGSRRMLRCNRERRGACCNAPALHGSSLSRNATRSRFDAFIASIIGKCPHCGYVTSDAFGRSFARRSP